MVARCWRWEVGKRDEDGQNVETSGYKINKVCGLKYSMVGIVNHTVLYI